MSSKTTDTPPNRNDRSANRQIKCGNASDAVSSASDNDKLDIWKRARSEMDPEESDRFYPPDSAWLLRRLGKLTTKYNSLEKVAERLGVSADTFKQYIGQKRAPECISYVKRGESEFGNYGKLGEDGFKDHYFGVLDAIYTEITEREEVSFEKLEDEALEKKLPKKPVFPQCAPILLVEAHCEDFGITFDDLNTLFEKIRNEGIEDANLSTLKKTWKDICDCLRKHFEIKWPKESTSVSEETISLWKKSPEPPRATLEYLKKVLLSEKPPILACGTLSDADFIMKVFPDELLELAEEHLGAETDPNSVTAKLMKSQRNDELVLAASEHFLANEGLPFVRLVERCDALCGGADDALFYARAEALFAALGPEDGQALQSGFLNYADSSLARGLAFVVLVVLLGTDHRLVIERIVNQRLARSVHPQH